MLSVHNTVIIDIPAPYNRSEENPSLKSSKIYRLILSNANCLVEWVGVGSPPGEEEGETDGLEDAGEAADEDGVEWALLGEDLCDELGLC